MKIGIVGAEESKWTEEQKIRAKKVIKGLLHGYTVDGLVRFSKSNKPIFFAMARRCEIILVSGHCHKKGVDIWAEDNADELGIEKEIYPAEVHQWPDKTVRVCRTCGELKEGLDEVVTHDALVNMYHPHYWKLKTKKGYRTRNIQVAETFNIGYCIVPYNPKAYCKHHKQYGHPSNGGCWTIKYAEKLGKETHLVLIE